MSAKCQYMLLGFRNFQLVVGHKRNGLEESHSSAFDFEEASALLKARVLCIRSGHRRSPRVTLAPPQYIWTWKVTGWIKFVMV